MKDFEWEQIRNLIETRRMSFDEAMDRLAGSHFTKVVSTSPGTDEVHQEELPFKKRRDLGPEHFNGA